MTDDQTYALKTRSMPAKRLSVPRAWAAGPARWCQWLACRSSRHRRQLPPRRRVARELDAIIRWRGKPDLIVSDHGTEFTSNALAWGLKQPDRLAFHCAGKTDAERDLRSFQRPHA
jgi:hypothetical protein